VSEITESAVSTAVEQALAAFAAATDSAALKAARAAHTADGSPLAKLNAAMRDVPNDQKAAAGKLVGEARGRVNAAAAEAQARIESAEEEAQLAAEAIDVTAVPSRRRLGARHPLSLLMEQMGDIFIGMGWEVADGPELEHAWFNFDALNIDPDHPARGEQDTFYVEPAGRPDGVGEGRRQDGRARLADAARLLLAVDNDHLDLRHLVHAQDRVIVEIGLLDPAVLDGDPAIERGADAVHQSTLDLLADDVRIDRDPAIDHGGEALQARPVGGGQFDLDDHADEAAEPFQDRHAAAGPGGQG